MEADQRGWSESTVGESNDSTITASADGSVDLRTAFGTVFNTRSSDGPVGPGNPSLADIGSEARPQSSNEEVARAATQSRTAASVQFSIDTNGLFQIGGVSVADDHLSNNRALSSNERGVFTPQPTSAAPGGVAGVVSSNSSVHSGTMGNSAAENPNLRAFSERAFASPTARASPITPSRFRVPPPRNRCTLASVGSGMAAGAAFAHPRAANARVRPIFLRLM